MASGLMTKKELRQFVKEHKFTSVEQIQNTLKELFKEVLEEALEAELDNQLGYDRHDVKHKQTVNLFQIPLLLYHGL